MQLSPRYDGPPVLVIDIPLDTPTVPLLRQRHRLASTLESLDDAQWATPSRCEGWSVQDVVSHLVGTNQFWTMSIAAGRSGTPTRFLSNFDPVATPATMVAADREAAPREVLGRFVESNGELQSALEGVRPEEWATVLAEAPPGHIALNGVVLHALWDGWIHERDVLVPLGLPHVEEADEVTACLAYGAGLSPAFLATTGSTREGTIAIEGTDPDTRLVVELGASVRVHGGPSPAGALRLAGRSVDLLEGLSLRAPLAAPVDDEHAWMFGGLGSVFDQTP